MKYLFFKIFLLLSKIWYGRLLRFRMTYIVTITSFDFYVEIQRKLLINSFLAFIMQLV